MRLINVSNRLPVTISCKKGKYDVSRSIGGVATGLNLFLKHYKQLEGNEVLWVGWSGVALNDDSMLNEKLQEKSCYPVPIPAEIADNYYHGFCNQTLWPLFHYLTSHALYNDEHWQSYQQVNELFCETLAKIIQPGDCVWIHDYHLFLLPRLLKDKFPNNNVGFFLHISFPSLEIFHFLPKSCRDELLRGVLGADLIGFHTHEYCQHFRRVVRRTLGFEQHMGYVKSKEKMVQIGVYPMGIDIKNIRHLLNTDNVISDKEKMLAKYDGLKVILSADRLDYTKGIINKLLAYQFFLETNPEWHHRVVLMLVVAPSREKLKYYSSIKKEIDELVGSINGKFGNVNWVPIHYQYKSLTMEQMIACYSAANIGLITPIRDGMNLIAKEFVAAKVDKKGVLILSETAGAAKELLGAIIANPHCKFEMVFALKQALEMPEEEQYNRMQSMQLTLEKYNLTNWGLKFLNDLLAVKINNNQICDKIINPEILKNIKGEYLQAKNRLIALDYDGTLVPLTKDPLAAIPGVEILELITGLAHDKKNNVVIISGRNKEMLEKWFGHLSITLIAEYSGWIKEQAWQKCGELPTKWKNQIRPILQIFTDRLEGSFVEEKEFSIAWHYRSADEIKGEEMARELSDYLIAYTDETDLKIVSVKKAIEIKNSHIGKNIAIEKMLARESYDFILAAGDDVTDEDMFLVLPGDAVSIKVGAENSYAKFHIDKQDDFVNLLGTLSLQLPS